MKRFRIYPVDVILVVTAILLGIAIARIAARFVAWFFVKYLLHA